MDGDFSAAVTERLTVSGGFNYVSGYYSKYPGAIGYPAQANLGSFTFDATGDRAINAPLWSGSVAGNYAIPTTVGKFDFNVNSNARAKVYVAVTNRLTNPGYAVVNTSMTWTPPNDRFNVRLWALNLLDKEYYWIRAESGTGDYQTYAPPRTFGISGTFKFGAYK